MGLPLGLLLMLQQPIIVDGHIDTPQRMLDIKADITARLADGHVDVPHIREGGPTAALFPTWVDSPYGRGTDGGEPGPGFRLVARTSPGVESDTWDTATSIPSSFSRRTTRRPNGDNAPCRCGSVEGPAQSLPLFHVSVM